MKAAYLDASALVKLFKREPETGALTREFRSWGVLVSSELIAIEARCTARRLGDRATLERVETVLAGIDLMRFTPELRDLAGAIQSGPPLRALDAIHLATALSMREDLGTIFVYDGDLQTAARAHGLDVTAPR